LCTIFLILARISIL
jgi:outer membrane protein assembly factor BamB